MKIFALFARITLAQKPEWLEEFREKFDEPSEIHVTLVQPRYVEEEKIEQLKKNAAQFFLQAKNPLRVRFDEVRAGPDVDGITIMVGSHDAPDLISFQERLCAALAGYGQYVKPEYEGYEKNFWPHITIGRKLTEEQFTQAGEYLKNGFVCEGAIEEVVFAAVDKQTVEEGKNPANRTLYNLS